MKLTALLVFTLLASTFVVESRFLSKDTWRKFRNKYANYLKMINKDNYKVPDSNQKIVEQPKVSDNTGPEVDTSNNVETEVVSDQGGADQCQRDFRATCISEHNRYRAMHRAPPLKGSSTLHLSSQSYSQKLASTNSFQHSGKNGVGENLAYSWQSSVKSLSNCADYAKKYVKMWYDEVSLYNFASGGFSGATGHFTQLVWKSTTEVGCGISISRDSKIYAVSQYTPPGNVQGRFKENVLPK